jgi:hypothetical protein
MMVEKFSLNATEWKKNRLGDNIKIVLWKFVMKIAYRASHSVEIDVWLGIESFKDLIWNTSFLVYV